MSLDSKDLWGIYAKSIAQAAGLQGSPANFILSGTALTANLATDSKAIGVIWVNTDQTRIERLQQLGE